jgi:hypothetical protein
MSTGVTAARNLMRRSREEHFAVGAFNVDNQETLLAIARAARAKNAPVLVEVSHGELGIIGLANMRSPGGGVAQRRRASTVKLAARRDGRSRRRHSPRSSRLMWCGNACQGTLSCSVSPVSFMPAASTAETVSPRP